MNDIDVRQAGPLGRNWDETFDVVVAGSGAAGLSAAIFAAKAGLKVLVCEKSARIGGTTALSNGMIWVPCAPQAVAAGIEDSLDRARVYLRGELGNYYRPDFIDALLEDGPAAVTELERDTEVRFTLAGAPDYHSSREGGVDKGRALSPAPYDGRLLGADFDLIGDPIRVVLGGMMISSGEVTKFLNPFKSTEAISHVAKRVTRYGRDRLRHRRGTELSGGNALIARMLVTLRRLGVEVRTETEITGLEQEGGCVVGVTLARAGQVVAVAATRGVILATGGFARNAALRDDLGRKHPHDHTLAHPDVTGDGITLARSIGAAVDTDAASPGFWTPISLLKEARGETTVPYGWLDRGRPGVIAVGPDGKRFVNESNAYHDICMGLFDNGYPEDRRFYFICDHDFVVKRGMGQIMPWPWTPGLGKWISNGYIQTGATIEELAVKIGIDPAALRSTVDRNNAMAETGKDPEFGRGESAFNRTLGDPLVGKKNPNLGPISKAPFVALQIVPATLGTAVGLKTDTEGRVLDSNDGVVSGLYACGNDMTSPMRGLYPGAGITIGPAIVFAYRAVNTIARTARSASKSPELAAAS